MAASEHRFTVQDDVIILDSVSLLNGHLLAEQLEDGRIICKVPGIQAMQAFPYRITFNIAHMHVKNMNKIMHGVEFELGLKASNRQLLTNQPVRINKTGRYLELAT